MATDADFNRAIRRRVLLEVCVGSVDDALYAVAGGADRLELNAALGLGGLTPSIGCLIETKAAVTLPIIAMVRPRPGGFAYSDTDFQIMLRDADLLLEHGAAGLAFGILRENGSVDVDRCRRFLERIPEGVDAVFHRAFDVTPDPIEALECLIELGCKRVLTSGQAGTAQAGAETIASLIAVADGRIEILPGAGINADTVGDVIARTGCNQVHGSLRSTRFDASTQLRSSIRFGSERNPPEDQYDATDPARVRQLRAKLDD